MPTTPTGRPFSMPPQLTASIPASTRAAPTSPPTRAWPLLEGSPSHQVSMFQVTAAARPQPMPVIEVNSGCANGEMIPRRISTASTPPFCPISPPASAKARPM